MNTDLLDKAIIFAVNAHKGAKRKGKELPFIVHPIEVVSIASSITFDQEILAAAALHDVIEDAGYTEEDLKKEFGDRVAALVMSETDEVFEGVSRENSWKDRKAIQIEKIKNSSSESKIIALADKLSNMRAISRDYESKGDDFWNIFHTKDPNDHAWHYRGIADSLSEFNDTPAYKELVYLIEKVFTKACKNYNEKNK